MPENKKQIKKQTKNKTHRYPTNFSTSNCSIPLFKLIQHKYRISVRGPTLWKNTPTNPEKMQESVTVSKNSLRKKLLGLQIETLFFYSNCLKSWSTSSNFPKVLFGKVALQLLVFSGESLLWSVISFNCYANGQWSFSFITPLQIFSFPASSASLLLKHNSLFKIFLQKSFIWLYVIDISLYHCCVVAFCIWYFYFVYGKNKQTYENSKKYEMI